MRIVESAQNLLQVVLEPAEVLHYEWGFMRQPHFERPGRPDFWTRVFPDAFLKRLLAGRLWDAKLVGKEGPRTVRISGPDPHGKFIVVEVPAGSLYFVRIRHLPAYVISQGGGFRSSWNLLDPTRWLLRARSALLVAGPAQLVFYGAGLTRSAIEKNDHIFADQLIAFDAHSPFRLRCLLPEGKGWLEHLINATSATVDVEFPEGASVISSTARSPQANRMALLWKLVFVTLLGGWMVERTVLRTAPPELTTPAVRTGVVSDLTFPKGNFRPVHLEDLGPLAAVLGGSINSVVMERHAVCDTWRSTFLAADSDTTCLATGASAVALRDIYTQILKDTAFQGVSSAIPWCATGKGSANGNGFAYVPVNRKDSPTREAETIVLLHGYGGSLLWNLWILKQAFPEHVIIMPSGGIRWGSQDSAAIQQYIKTLTHKVEQAHGCRLQSPWLFAIRDGGPVAVKLLTTFPKEYRGYVAVACPASGLQTLASLPDVPVYVLHGANDHCNPINQVSAAVADLHASRTLESSRRKDSRLAETRLEIIGGGDELFFLNHHGKELAKAAGFIRTTERVRVSVEQERARRAAQAAAQAAARKASINEQALVGVYEGWESFGYIIWFTLKPRGELTAVYALHDSPDRFTRTTGRWSLSNGKLSIGTEMADTFFRSWLLDAPVTIDGRKVLLGDEHAPLIKRD